MALITLSNGKTIDIDIWHWLNMTDDEVQDLVAMNIGFEAENPFHSSSINSKSFEFIDNHEEEVPPVDKPDIDDPELLERDDI